jgi:hypothetical protein
MSDRHHDAVGQSRLSDEEGGAKTPLTKLPKTHYAMTNGVCLVGTMERRGYSCSTAVLPASGRTEDAPPTFTINLKTFPGLRRQLWFSLNRLSKIS